MGITAKSSNNFIIIHFTAGVHGPLIACHTQFTAEEFADLLHMPKEKPELRRVLSNEFNLLLSCGTERGFTTLFLFKIPAKRELSDIYFVF